MHESTVFLRRCLLLPILLALSFAAIGEGRYTDFLYGERDSDITVERLERNLDWARGKSDLDRETRLERIALYEKAIDHLEAYELFRKRYALLEEYHQETKAENRQLTQRLRAAESARGAPNPELDVTDLAIDELARLLRDTNAEEMIAQQNLVRLRRELAAQRHRLPQMRRQLTATVNQMRQSNVSRGRDQPGITPLLAEARRLELRTGQLSRQAQARLLTLELNTYNPRLKVLRMRLALEQLEAGQLERRGRVLETHLSDRRLVRTNTVVEETSTLRDRFASSHRLLRGASARNAEIGARLGPLEEVISASIARSRELHSQLRRIQENDAAIRQKIESSSSDATLSRAIERELRKLPEARSIASELENLESLGADLMLEMFAFEEQIEALNDVQDFARRLTGSDGALSVGELAPDASELDALSGLLRERHAIYRMLLSWTEFYRIQIAQNVHFLGLLYRTLSDFEDYLNERRLWTRSTTGELALEAPGRWSERDRVAWHAENGGLLDILRSGPSLRVNFVPALLLALVLLLLRKKLIRGLVGTARYVGDSEHDRFKATVMALLITVLLAVPLALVVGSLALQLALVQEHTRLSLALEAGFIALAQNLFWLGFVFELCRSNGLAQRHFGWDPVMLEEIRRASLWLLIPLLPLGLWNQSLASYYAIESEYLFMSLTGVLSLLIVCGVGFYYLREHGAIVTTLRSGRHHVAVGRVRWVRLLAFICAPLIVLGLAVFGYSRAAIVIGTQLKEGLIVALAVMVFYEIGKRWVVLHRGTGPGYDDGMRLVTALTLVLTVLGLLFVWSTALPALGYFYEIEIWRYNSVIDDKVIVNAVSLADLIIALLALWLVMFLYRHLPPILHLLLVKLPLATGNRYTIVTLSTYVLVCVGFGFAMYRLGVEWQRFQWLFAALGVGIGFGLREIVANFVSGFIIMLERPVRVGDLVTIGDVEGTVSHIRIRATSITTLDHQELLVPNKDFITGSLLNWSLSDPVARIAIGVGVAYRTDVDRAMDLIMANADSDPLVLKHPAPFVTCEDFGDDSIDLCLRFFMDDMDERLETRSRLILGINRSFIDADIEIAFPQRDVHFDTDQPLKVELQPARDS